MRTFGISPARAALFLVVTLPIVVACIPVVAGILLVDRIVPRR